MRSSNLLLLTRLFRTRDPTLIILSFSDSKQHSIKMVQVIHYVNVPLKILTVCETVYSEDKQGCFSLLWLQHKEGEMKPVTDGCSGDASELSQISSCTSVVWPHPTLAHKPSPELPLPHLPSLLYAPTATPTLAPFCVCMCIGVQTETRGQQ